MRTRLPIFRTLRGPPTALRSGAMVVFRSALILLWPPAPPSHAHPQPPLPPRPSPRQRPRPSASARTATTPQRYQGRDRPKLNVPGICVRDAGTYTMTVAADQLVDPSRAPSGAHGLRTQMTAHVEIAGNQKKTHRWLHDRTPTLELSGQANGLTPAKDDCAPG